MKCKKIIEEPYGRKYPKFFKCKTFNLRLLFSQKKNVKLRKVVTFQQNMQCTGCQKQHNTLYKCNFTLTVTLNKCTYSIGEDTVTVGDTTQDREEGKRCAFSLLHATHPFLSMVPMDQTTKEKKFF